MSWPLPRTRDARGMTLIEVMVAVSLLALMGMLVYGSLVITITSQQRAEVLQERYHAARVFLHRIKRELSMSYLSLHQAEDQRTQTLFDGESDQVIFNTSAYEPIRRDAHESDQIEVEYRLDRDDEGEPADGRRSFTALQIAFRNEIAEGAFPPDRAQGVAVDGLVNGSDSVDVLHAREGEILIEDAGNNVTGTFSIAFADSGTAGEFTSEFCVNVP